MAIKVTRSTADILRAARERIADPARWTTGHLALTSSGRAIGPSCANAACWCARGALCAEGVDPWRSSPGLLLEGFSHELFETGVETVNDNLGHVAVLQVFDAAIAAAEADRS